MNGKIPKAFYGLITAICILMFARSYGQQALVASGGSVGGENGSVSYSIGQVFYSSQTGTNGLINQGVQQVYLEHNDLSLVLKNMTLETAGSQVQMYWEPVSQIEHAKFIVERSENGTDWVSKDAINGGNNNLSAMGFSYVDANPIDVGAYYKIKQMDIDGKFKFSNVIFIKKFNNQNGAIAIYPNPTTEGIYLQVEKFEALNYSLSDASGRIILEKKLESSVTFIDLNAFVTSVYFLTVKNSKNYQVFKIIKN